IVDSEETKNEEDRLIRRQSGVIIGRHINKESDEGSMDHSKKLKGVETLSDAAQYLLDIKTATKASKNDFICKPCIKGLAEGFGMIQEVPDGLRGSSSNSNLKSEDEERFLTTDDETSLKKSNDEVIKIDDSKKAKDMKDADEQAGTEQPEKFINENHDVSLTDVLQEPFKAEFQSLVDVLVLQENPVVQRTLLVDTNVTMIPETTTHSPTQQLK
nr:hypothetical protein [Tanacetum cinerariifolium]